MVIDNDLTLINQNENDAAEWTDDQPESDNDDDAYFHWEEEDTLFSDLLEQAAPESGNSDLVALAQSLQKPFDDESRQLKKEIAATFVPLVNKIKGIYATLDETVDLPFGAGLLLFNDGCKGIEKSTSSNMELLQRLQAEHRTRVGGVLERLEEEYARRERLWVDFQKSMDALVNPVIEMLNETPARLERTIGSMEKQARVLEKEGAAALASATEMTLQEIISKLK
ncbi:hypothetical protein AGABI1DRAFT_82209 [Agaricus bisporus var. burnettii JB137-S8]|uniref:Uncharacterized protein n=1 Tax=Agaricus bisporus var. burnettii (strain JB137-S8 / ATCC MYA-4627 / FGSC 10392) TaxID=597362 RepID=K5XGM6_AGABU|nr:uncharacterized protein AGABI1DRAFT_82209 [Agaricus bisporus var. burnettii JB137-S8]EKM82427.1 hypothetical protein AGABI1DRAFT_82209 [Agaricus bisporus var. burnettii JB137-S8]